MPTDHQPASAGSKHSNRSRGGGKGRVRANPSNSGKRSSYPWINTQIIAASETGVLQHLLATVVTHLPQMNLVNLSTAIHRLAKLSADDPRALAELRQHPTMGELLQAITTAFARLEAGEVQPQSLSNVAWSLAAMRFLDRSLLQVVAQLAVANITCFKPFELSTMLWALAKLGSMPQAKSWCAKPVFHAAAVQIMKQVQHFGFRCLATTVWAFATAKQRHARLFRSIASQMVSMVHVANCQEMANTAWAFGTADFHNDQLFTEIAEKALLRLDEFKPQELSNMLWGFATNSFFHEAFYASASVMAQHMDLQAQHLANILWAFARVRSKHPVTQATALALLPHCTKQLDTFKPQEVSSTALAVAKCFGYDTDHVAQRSPKADMHASVCPPLVPPPVRAFFDAALPWALARLNEFSAQSLANMVSAYTMTQVAGSNALFVAVSKEVMQRYNGLEPTALLHLLKSFVAVPKEIAGNVVRALAAGVERHTDELRPQELQTLSRICVNAFDLGRGRDLTKEELHSSCLTLGRTGGTDAPVGTVPLPLTLAAPTVPPDPERGASCVREAAVFREPLHPVPDKAAVEVPFSSTLLDVSVVQTSPLSAVVDVPPVLGMDIPVAGPPTFQLASALPGHVFSCSAEHSDLTDCASAAQSIRASALSMALAQPVLSAAWQSEELLHCLAPSHMHGQSSVLEPSLRSGGFEAGGYDAGYEAVGYQFAGYEDGGYDAGGFEPATAFVGPLPAAAAAAAAVAVPVHPPVLGLPVAAGQRMPRGRVPVPAQTLAPVCEITETGVPQQFVGEQAIVVPPLRPVFAGDASVRRGPWWSAQASSGSSPRGRQMLNTPDRAAQEWRCSVKNSFLHVEPSDQSDDDCDEANTDGGSSQRSSSVPSRFDHEIWEDWHRRNFDTGYHGSSNHWGRRGDDFIADRVRFDGSASFHPHGLKGDVGGEQHGASMTGKGPSLPAVDAQQLGMLFQV